MFNLKHTYIDADGKIHTNTNDFRQVLVWLMEDAINSKRTTMLAQCKEYYSKYFSLLELTDINI